MLFKEDKTLAGKQVTTMDRISPGGTFIYEDSLFIKTSESREGDGLVYGNRRASLGA